jgi:hypothetical protein
VATEKAPVEVTGGAGHEFDDSVAGRFLIDLLTGGCSLGAGLGQVTEIRWQVRESGLLGDDLVITCRLGGNERRVALSVKSDRQVTQSGFPSDFVELAWELWRGLAGAVATKGTGNGVGLVVGGLAAGVEDAWNKLAVEVRESRADLQRVLDRLRPPSPDDPGSQSSELERALARSFACPLAGETQDEPSVESLEVISQVHLLHLDFRSPSSRQESLALADCRKMLASGDETQARNLWNELRALAGRKRSSGGTVTLAEVLAELRPLFVLRVHPDFDADWRSLDRSAQEAVATVSFDIGTVGSVLRAGDLEKIRNALLEHKVVALVGPSGVGKSGLAKRIAIEPGTRTCWLTADVVDQDSLALVEQRLGINHAFDAVLAANPSTCTLVLDALEKFGVRAQERLQQLIRRLLEQNPPHLRLVVTAQLDSVEVVARLMALGVPADRLVQVSVDSPSEDEIRAVLGSHTNVHWASLSQAVRPVLRNLKVADWVMRAVEAGAMLNASEVFSISALIDWLWRCPWIQGADDGDERSALMMSLAIKEGASLSAGVPRNSLDQGEQRPLRGLQQSGALFRRHERLFFQHDLLSDWSRLRVLMGEHPQSVASLRDRAANVRWHHAIRLYGLWLLESLADGPVQWGRLASEAERAGDTALRDLVLESVFIASQGAQTLLNLWPILVAEDGALLNALLERFLYASTVPDPRLTAYSARSDHPFRKDPIIVPTIRSGFGAERRATGRVR